VAETPDPRARYYDSLAKRYDEDRFGHSYGRYLDHLERHALARWLPPVEGRRILDLACGTGRLLDFASEGLDQSASMLEIAASKHSQKPLYRASASAIPVDSGTLDAIFSLHFFMHLTPREIGGVMEECHRVLKPGGLLVFDIPSAERRRLAGFEPTSWHAATALTLGHLRTLAAQRFLWGGHRGLLAAPVHRVPESLRGALLPLDRMLGRSPARRWCSYHLVRLVRAP